MIILGISGLYHDSAAALIEDGKVMAAAQEERFTRIKNDASLPVHAIKYCLNYRNIEMKDADLVIYYDNPMITLNRFLKNLQYCRKDAKDLLRFQYDNLLRERVNIHKALEAEFGLLGKTGKLLVANHHASHAASAFFPSPYEEAAILTMDGVGEWNTLTIGRGKDNQIETLKKIDYPHSLGLLYSAFTQFCGFKVNSGEYKLMGLAPYGQPKYSDLIKKYLVDIKEDGSFRLNLECFDFQYGRGMINQKFENLFQTIARKPEQKIDRMYMDAAASIQLVTEEIVLKLAKSAAKYTGINTNLVLAGGIALNCVANGKLAKEKIFEHIWIQPAAGDAGGAIGAAFLGYYQHMQQKRKIEEKEEWQNVYLGPIHSDNEIEDFLRLKSIKYHDLRNEENKAKRVAELLNQDKVIGLFQGRMEFGPRALGNRSIIASAQSAEMQSKINLKIKFRESFRPFAPAVMKEKAKDYFDLKEESPYMLLCAPVKKEKCSEFDVEKEMNQCGNDMLQVSKVKRSDIPAVTHVDFSARVQTVDKKSNREFYEIIKEYYNLTGCPVIVNTSFNVRGEPIVCTMEEAYTCFMRTNMDVLILNRFLLYKEEQIVLS